MSSRIELANPNLYATPQEYIERHLAPIVSELQRITSELITPGSTSAEEWEADMVPSSPNRATFSPLDKRVDDLPKHLIFSGGEYLTIPKELLRSKQLKVQLTVVAYRKGRGKAEFRLVRDDGVAVMGSEFVTDCHVPTAHSLTLPFGNAQGCVAPETRSYIIQGRSIGAAAIPVCRRFSMSFVYI